MSTQGAAELQVTE